MISPDERLILVNERDEVVGPELRSRCHAGEGILHRAFSVYLFDRQGRLLLQRRSHHKHLWPLYWSNSCCSHPRWGERTSEAAHRRLREELGLSSTLRRALKFRYRAVFGERGSENEMCVVYVGQADSQIRAEPREVGDWRFVSASELERELEQKRVAHTPWLRIGWARLRAEYRRLIL